MIKQMKYIFVIAYFLIISGCAIQQTTQPPAAGEWAFRGKMAVRNSEQSSSFNVHWIQQNDDFQIELSGPLGQGAVSVKGQPGLVTLTQGDKEIQAHTLAELVYRTAELDLPLDHLQYWVRALPSPGYKFTKELNDLGQIAQINQQGWTVSYPAFFTTNPAMPKKLNFAKADDSGKLVIREWTQLPLP